MLYGIAYILPFHKNGRQTSHNPETVTMSTKQLHMHLRATRAIPALALEPGDQLRVTLASDGRVTMTRDDHQPEEVEIQEIHMALTDGAMVESLKPTYSLDEVKGVIEARAAFLTAELEVQIAEVRASSAT
jgi:hypothetical protein